MSEFIRKTDDEVRRMSDEEVIAYNKQMRAIVAARPQTDETREFIAKLDADVAAFEKTVEAEKKAIQKALEATHELAIAEDKMRDCLKKMVDERSQAVNLHKAYLMIGHVSPAAAIQFLIAAKTPEKPGGTVNVK